jgi:hypothetical protein
MPPFPAAASREEQTTSYSVAVEKAFAAKAFVNIRPFMNTVASCHDFPVVALLGRGLQETWQPGKRHGNGTVLEASGSLGSWL